MTQRLWFSRRYSSRERDEPDARGAPGQEPPPRTARQVPPAQRPELTITEALNRGLIDLRHGVYKDPMTGDRVPLAEAVDAGLLGCVPAPKPGLTMPEAMERGFFELESGNCLDPQTGRVITLGEWVT